MNAISGWISRSGFCRQFESLFEDAVRGGFFVNTKQGWYSCPTWKEPDKNFRTSYLQSNQAAPIWKTFIEQFDSWSYDSLSYKSINQNNIEEELDKMSEEETEENIIEDSSED